MWNKKNRIVDWGIILLFLLIPVILNWKALSSNELMFEGDGMISFSPKIFLYQSLASGEVPLWNSYVITGSPFLADPLSAFYYPFHALALFFSPTLYTNLYYILHVWLAGIFTYLYLKQIGIQRLAAIAGGIVFSLSPIIAGVRREHVAVYTSIIWMPLVLFFIEKYLQSGRKKHLIFSALALTLQLVGGSPQWVVYTGILAFCYLFIRSLSLKHPIIELIKEILLWASAFLLFSSAYILPVAESIAQSSRGGADYFCLYSTSWPLFLMTIFPNVFGDIYFPLGNYASAEVSIEVFVGTITLIYAVYAIRYHFSNWHIKFSAAAMILSLIYSSSCNTPYLADIIKHIPPLNLFGVQSRTLFVFVFFSIVCFASGISDLCDTRYLKRLTRYSFFTVLFFFFLSALIYTRGWFINSGVAIQSTESIMFTIFGIPIILSVINFVLIAALYLTQNYVAYKYSSIVVMVFLIFLSGADIWRFSSIHPVANFDVLTQTEETISLKKLLKDNNFYRVMAIYQNIYGGDYYKSGLVDNWSEINQIRNIKGFSEFENPHLNELLKQTASRDNENGPDLLSDGDILSMLSVKYVLIPHDSPAPKSIPSLPETEVLDLRDSITIPGNGTLFVNSIPIQLKDQGYYQIKLNMEASGTDVPLFYTDFYGGPNYDQARQDKHFKVKKGSNNYSGIIYAGDKIPNQGKVDFRIVSITNIPLVLKNLKITKLVDPSENPNYELISQTRKYRIYENKQARELLYIPQEVRSIKSTDNLIRNPGKYPSMDHISYVQDYKNFLTGGDLEILNIKNNTLTAHVSSQSPTFVVHAQSFYPGWKAYVDDKPAHIHLVNGVIQGVEVPAGEHIVKFEYDPWSVKVGMTISILALLSTSFYLAREKRKTAGKPL